MREGEAAHVKQPDANMHLSSVQLQREGSQQENGKYHNKKKYSNDRLILLNFIVSRISFEAAFFFFVYVRKRSEELET